MNETDIAILQAARILQRHPSNPWQKEIQDLLVRAEAGENVTVQLIDLLRQNQNVRRWMYEQIADSSACFKGFEQLTGDKGDIPASQRWVCPHEGCIAKSLPVIREGEDPPVCEIHNVPMVRRAR